MTLTERKRCDKCKAAGSSIYSLFLKVNPAEGIEEEECLSCGWRDEEQFWPNQISAIGLEQAKQEWEDNRDCQLNKDIEQEMNLFEKAQWEKYKKNKKLISFSFPPPMTHLPSPTRKGNTVISVKRQRFT